MGLLWKWDESTDVSRSMVRLGLTTTVLGKSAPSQSLLESRFYGRRGGTTKVAKVRGLVLRALLLLLLLCYSGVDICLCCYSLYSLKKKFCILGLPSVQNSITCLSSVNIYGLDSECKCRLQNCF